MPYLKLLLKQKFPLLYKLIRKLSFSIYLKKRSKKLAFMGDTVTGNFTYQNISFPIILKKRNGFVDQEIFWKGCYEEDVLAVIKAKLPIDGTFVDVGANIGDHSLFAAHVAIKGKVIAFEPLPHLYRQCLNSQKLSEKSSRGAITFYNVACGEKDGSLSIFSPEGNVGGSSFIRNEGAQEEVSVVRGDSLLCEEKRVDMIKIDVEGFEYATLRGLENTIKQHSPIIILELSPSFYAMKKETSFDEEKILRFLQEYNYAVEGIDESIPYTENPLTIYPTRFEQVNLLFTSLPKAT